MQERCNSIANALELRLSCTNPSICNKSHCRDKTVSHSSHDANGVSNDIMALQ